MYANFNFTKIRQHEGYTASLRTSRERTWSWNISSKGFSSLQTISTNISELARKILFFLLVNLQERDHNKKWQKSPSKTEVCMFFFFKSCLVSTIPNKNH